MRAAGAARAVDADDDGDTRDAPAPEVERLYREHGPALFRYLVRFTGGDEAAAADALQESFMRLVEQRTAVARPRQWLFTVATRLVQEAGRRRVRRHRLLAAAPLGALVADPPPDPAASLDRAERRALALAALAALPARDRTLLLMREEGFSHREMAEAVGTTTKSVGTLVARALTRLAAALPPHAEHDA
jgi:RNA polymerase sigma-70 factor (ECF subfamily)